MAAGSFLKGFFPSWRFFESLGPMPRLYCRHRLASGGGEYGDWVPVLGRSRRSALSLLLNAEGNLDLACNSLVERLASDLEEVPESMDEAARERFFASTTYVLVRNLVRYRLRERGLTGAGCVEFQFKLAMEPGETLLVSRAHEA